MLAGEKKTKIPLVMMIQDSFAICWKKIPLTSLEKAKKKRRFLMAIDTNTDGWELLSPLVGIVAKQRCSEIAGYSESETSSSQSF